jgi:hypothetical protein
MGTPATEKTSPNLTLDLNDPVYAALTQFARRISQLLAAPAVTANSDLESSLHDFLGAVYALIIAKRKNFQDRPDRPINIKPVAQRAARIAAGNVKTDGLWIAGFYFNNALFRTAAVYHRILKIVAAPAKGDVPTLQSVALARYAGWNSIRLHKVHSQVNELKHDPQGVYRGRLVSYREALTAAGDLLDLIEAWTANATPDQRHEQPQRISS